MSQKEKLIIYKTINLVNGKIYVGQDSKDNPEYLGSGVLIKQAINKYKRKNFNKEILEYCSTKELLNIREVYWIEKLNSRNPKIGYNLSIGGEGIPLGHKHSDVTKERMSNAKKGSIPWTKGKTLGPITEKTRDKMSKAKLGKSKSEKTKKLLSEARISYLKKNGPVKRSPLSEETKDKIRKSKEIKKLIKVEKD